MTLSAASITFGPNGPTLTAAAPLPVEALVLGRPVAEAAELLPRLFNLCRMAQGLAAKLALGLPATEDPGTEIIRDHVLSADRTQPASGALFALNMLACTNGGNCYTLADITETLERPGSRGLPCCRTATGWTGWWRPSSPDPGAATAGKKRRPFLCYTFSCFHGCPSRRGRG